MSKKDPKPRIDPDNERGLDFHAKRALARKKDDETSEFEHLDPALQRKAILHPGTTFREPEMRGKLLAMIDQIDKTDEERTPEQEELIRNIEDQYDDAIAVFKNNHHVRLDGSPTRERISEWLRKLPQKTLNGILKFKDTATLVLVPPVSAVKLLGPLKANPGTNVSSNLYESEDLEIDWRYVEPKKWTFGITDTKKAIPFDDTLLYKNPNEKDVQKRVNRTRREILIEKKSRLKADGMTIMPQYAGVPVFLSANANGIHMKDLSLEGDVENNKDHITIPYIAWSMNNDFILLGCHHHTATITDDESGFVCFRPWVGEIENS